MVSAIPRIYAGVNRNSFSHYQLAWLTQREARKKKEKIHDLPVLATCWSGTLPMLSSEVNCPVAHGKTRQGLVSLIGSH